MEQYAVLIALVMSLTVGGTYTQWTKSNLLQACENRVDVQFICPGGLRCEDCPRCVTEFLGECMCVPQSFLSEYPDPDPLYSCCQCDACYRFFWLYDWTQPKCCEAVKDQMKRNRIRLGSSESANQNIGLQSNIADTNKRANGQLINTTDASQDYIGTSVIGDDESSVNENNNNGNYQTNVDITEKHSGNGVSNANNGKDGTGTKTPNDNRTKPVTNKTEGKYEDRYWKMSDSARNKRDSLLMRALILTQELLTAEDMRRGIRHRYGFK